MFNVVHDLARLVSGGIRSDLCEKSRGCQHEDYAHYRAAHPPTSDSFAVSDALHAAAHHGIRETQGRVMNAYAAGQRPPSFNTEDHQIYVLV